MPSALWLPLLGAVRQVVIDLGLPELPPANVLIQPVPVERPADFPLQRHPALLIAPHAAERIDARAGTNLRDQVVYPIGLALIDDRPLDPCERLTLSLGWRSRLAAGFSPRRLVAADCFHIEIEPLEVVDRTLWLARGLWLSRLVLHCFTRELRG